MIVSYVKGWAVRMYQECRRDYPCDTAAMKKVAELLGVGKAESVRIWVRQAEIDAGARPGVTSDDSAKMKRFKRENAELQRANSSGIRGEPLTP